VEEPAPSEGLEAANYPVCPPVGDRADHEEVRSDIAGDTSQAGTLTAVGPQERPGGILKEQAEADFVSPISDSQGENSPLPRLVKESPKGGVTLGGILTPHIMDDPLGIRAELLDGDQGCGLMLCQERRPRELLPTWRREKRVIASDHLQDSLNGPPVSLFGEHIRMGPKAQVKGPS